MSLRPRHSKSLIYASVKCPDSRNFDVFHGIIESGALQFIEQGRRAGENHHSQHSEIAVIMF